MSLEAILAAIEASGEAEAAHLRAEAESRAQQILDGAKRKAVTSREQARQAALRPAAGERARRLHQAKLEALRAVGQVRIRLVGEALAETRRRQSALRADPAYPVILRRLVDEAIRALGFDLPRAEEDHAGPNPPRASMTYGPDNDESQTVLQADPRDEALLRRILDDLGLNLTITPSLNCWGGVVACSSDGRVVAINTLEARLERAIPFLRRDLAAFLEEGLKDCDARPGLR